MVQEPEGSRRCWAAIESIASKIVCVLRTKNESVKPAEVDAAGQDAVQRAPAASKSPRTAAEGRFTSIVKAALRRHAAARPTLHSG